MNIYVASSWKTAAQPFVVRGLRALGHEVYDFREDGFSWDEVAQCPGFTPDWQNWTPEQSRAALLTAPATRGFRRDRAALDACDVCVLVLPCGRSSHLELGYAVGKGKVGIVFWPPDVHPYDPDLMYGLCDYFVISTEELIRVVSREQIVR